MHITQRIARFCTCALLIGMVAGCAGSPKSKAALEQMSVQQLIREMVSPSAAQPSYWGYDATYVDRIRQEWVRRTPGWPDTAKKAVLAGNIHQGMTFDQVVASWGPPSSMSSSTHGNLNMQTLIYNRGHMSWQSVSLQNGVVTGWSNHN